MNTSLEEKFANALPMLKSGGELLFKLITNESDGIASYTTGFLAYHPTEAGQGYLQGVGVRLYDRYAYWNKDAAAISDCDDTPFSVTRYSDKLTLKVPFLKKGISYPVTIVINHYQLISVKMRQEGGLLVGHGAPMAINFKTEVMKDPLSELERKLAPESAGYMLTFPFIKLPEKTSETQDYRRKAPRAESVFPLDHKNLQPVHSV